MHRNEGANMNLEGAIPRFIDRNLPGQPGSTAMAEWANAITDELINVLEEAGITYNSTAAEDRAQGWVQLRNAIFRSNKLGAPAIEGGSLTYFHLSTDTLYNQDLLPLFVRQLSPGNGELVLDDEVIQTANIEDSAITTAKLDDGAVTSDKLGANSVTAGKIATAAVNRTNLDTDVIDVVQTTYTASSGVTGVSDSHIPALDIPITAPATGVKLYRVDLLALFQTYADQYQWLRITDQADNNVFNDVLGVSLPSDWGSASYQQMGLSYSNVLSVAAGSGITGLRVWLNQKDGVVSNIRFIVQELKTATT